MLFYCYFIVIFLKERFESAKGCKSLTELFKVANTNESSKTVDSAVDIEIEPEIYQDDTSFDLPLRLDESFIIDSSVSVIDFNECLNLNITDEVKNKLLTQDFTPENDYEFPAETSSGTVRYFLKDYLKQYSWLIYSKEACGAFCRYCVLFCKNKKFLISKPLVKYKNILSDLSAHNKSIHHISSLQDAENFKLIFENKKDKINVELDKNLKKSLKVTRSGLISITKTLIFLAKQNLAKNLKSLYAFSLSLVIIAFNFILLAKPDTKSSISFSSKRFSVIPSISSPKEKIIKTITQVKKYYTFKILYHCTRYFISFHPFTYIFFR